MDSFELIIIGSGPAGQNAFFEALSLKKKVALIERENWLGGVSLNTGTIPSKALREAIYSFYEINQKKSLFRQQGKYHPVFWSTYLLPRVADVVGAEKKVLEKKLSGFNAPLFWGEAAFLDQKHIVVQGSRQEVVLQAEKFLIATGTKAAVPESIPFNQSTIVDADHLFRIEQCRPPLAIIGSGIVALEYASMFACLGLEVELFVKTDSLLPYIDSQIRSYFLEILARQRVQIHYRCADWQVTEKPSGAQITTPDGNKEFGLVVYAGGRQADIDALRLQEIGVQLNEKGFISIDKNYQTSVENIYAAGDVAGAPATASAARIHGRRAVRAIFGSSGAEIHYLPVFAIYTIPEIAFTGPCTEELKKQNLDFVEGSAYYENLSRAAIEGETQGFLKLVFARDSKKLLSAQAIGARCSELVHLAQMAISYNVGIDYFLNGFFNFPTYSELFSLAAFAAAQKF